MSLILCFFLYFLCFNPDFCSWLRHTRRERRERKTVNFLMPTFWSGTTRQSLCKGTLSVIGLHIMLIWRLCWPQAIWRTVALEAKLFMYLLICLVNIIELVNEVCLCFGYFTTLYAVRQSMKQVPKRKQVLSGHKSPQKEAHSRQLTTTTCWPTKRMRNMATCSLNLWVLVGEFESKCSVAKRNVKAIAGSLHK